jgi:hypothetical protein
MATLYDIHSPEMQEHQSRIKHAAHLTGPDFDAVRNQCPNCHGTYRVMMEDTEGNPLVRVCVCKFWVIRLNFYGHYWAGTGSIDYSRLIKIPPTPKSPYVMYACDNLTYGDGYSIIMHGIEMGIFQPFIRRNNRAYPIIQELAINEIISAYKESDYTIAPFVSPLGEIRRLFFYNGLSLKIKSEAHGELCDQALSACLKHLVDSDIPSYLYAVVNQSDTRYFPLTLHRLSQVGEIHLVEKSH